MYEIPISQEGIDNLGLQLESIEGAEERALLAGIVALASKALHGGSSEDPIPPQLFNESDPESPVVVATDGAVPDFQAQIDQAFTPGRVYEKQDGVDAFRVLVGHVVSITVDRGPQS